MLELEVKMDQPMLMLIQQPEIVVQITADMEANPDSQFTPDDVVSQCDGTKKDSRGASGVGINRSSMKKMLPVFQRDEFVEQNNEVWKKNMTSSVDELKAMVSLLANPLSERNRAGGSHNPTTSLPREDEASSPNRSLINSRVLLQGGWLPKDCAKGVIKSVNPLEKLGDRLVGSRNYIVYINVVIGGSAQLPEPHDVHTSALAELGQSTRLKSPRFTYSNFLRVYPKDLSSRGEGLLLIRHLSKVLSWGAMRKKKRQQGPMIWVYSSIRPHQPLQIFILITMREMSKRLRI